MRDFDALEPMGTIAVALRDRHAGNGRGLPAGLNPGIGDWTQI